MKNIYPNPNDLVEYNNKTYKVVSRLGGVMIVTDGKHERELLASETDIIVPQFVTDIFVYDNNGNPIPATNWDDDDGMEDTMCDYNMSVEIATEIVTDFAPDKAIAFIYPCEYDLTKQSWRIPENKTPAYTITTMDKALLNKLNFTADLLVEV